VERQRQPLPRRFIGCTSLRGGFPRVLAQSKLLRNDTLFPTEC
jgi:hypothetical protein